LLPWLSHLSVSFGPESRFRHRCSSQYLRISPLHWEFRSPLPYSSPAVSKAMTWLSRAISPLTYKTTYMPFTPNKSGQRSPPLYYRGCWHRVSRGLFYLYGQTQGLFTLESSSRSKEVYNPKTFVLHAVSLHQAFAHCGIFQTAASRRSLGRISVPVWPITLSGRLTIVALVGHYPAN
jgi:hypothetical protein